MTTKSDPIRDVRCDRSSIIKRMNLFICRCPLTISHLCHEKATRWQRIVICKGTHSDGERVIWRINFRWNWNIMERSLLQPFCLLARFGRCNEKMCIIRSASKTYISLSPWHKTAQKTAVNIYVGIAQILSSFVAAIHFGCVWRVCRNEMRNFEWRIIFNCKIKAQANDVHSQSTHLGFDETTETLSRVL